MDRNELTKVIGEGKLIYFLINYIISKSKDSEGKLSNLGKASIGIVGSLVLMFFFMLGYSFLYGIYFGNSSKYISILDIGLNIVPIDTKFVISIGILILILSCIYILPIKNLFFKKGILTKLINILVIAFCIYVSLCVFKVMLIGNVIFAYEDIYMIVIPLIIPMIIFGSAYITKCLSNVKNVILLVIALTVTIMINIISIKIISFSKKLDLGILILLMILFMPVVSITSNIIESILQKQLDMLVFELKKLFKFIKKMIVMFVNLIRYIFFIKYIFHKRNIIQTTNKKEKFTIVDFFETLIISVICIATMLIAITPNFFAVLGSYYGTQYVHNNKQVITYSQDNIQKQKIGNIVGCKDGNYYISEYPNKNLVILKSTQAIVETHVTGWYNVNNKWYYFDSNGEMLQNATTPDGYKVDEKGVLIK